MSIEAAIRTYLLADPAILSSLGTRYYPMAIPQDPIYPAVSYQRIDTVDDLTHDGNTGLVTARFQLTLWTKSFSQSLSVGDQLRARIKYYGPNRSSFSRELSGIPVDNLWLAGDIPTYVPETTEYQRIIDFFVTYSEANP